MKTADHNQQLQRVLYLKGSRSICQDSGPLSCQPTYYAGVRPLAVCIHKGGSSLCEVYYLTISTTVKVIFMWDQYAEWSICQLYIVPSDTEQRKPIAFRSHWTRKNSESSN